MARFKIQARAVDMLGRQQIAGVPTAIAELFKNAHDAYADRVEADYFYEENLLVIRDDGMGMTKEDLESRWLTLGTDSKVGLEPPPPDPKKDKRPILGEKGIGRLAIALLGKQVLLLTRPGYGEDKGRISAAFVNWSLFECPGLTLEDVEIAVLALDSAAPPSRDDIDGMIGIARRNVKDLRKRIGAGRANRILKELDSFDVDPAHVLSGLGKPSLHGKGGRGTCFLIQPVIDQIERDIELDRKEGPEVSDLRRQLLGFCNTMNPEAHPRLKTALRYWPTNEHAEGDLIEDREFFAPEELEQADHRIRGRFDENGNWSGTVSVYGEPPQKHEIPWREGEGRKSACGTFAIDFAYIQGTPFESRLPEDEYVRMGKKLDAYGGLYVYRDGVRVSPYGSPEQDFLKFEDRRSRRASYYFFSYRRMFGAISISTDANPALTDKAGREGLQQNRAYRDFQSILIGFFIQLAADFRKGGKESEVWERLRDDMQKKEKARKAREEKTKKQREALSEVLETFFDNARDSEVEEAVNAIVDGFEEVANREEYEDPRAFAEELQRAERAAQADLSRLRESLEISVPEDLGLTREQRRDLAAHEAKVSELEEKVFGPAEQRVTAKSAETISELREAIDTEERVENLVSDVLSEARRRIDEEAQATRESLERIENRVSGLIDWLEAQVNDAANGVETEIRVRIEERLGPAQLAEVRYDLVRQLVGSTREAANRLHSLRAQLDDIDPADSEVGGGVSSLEMTAALEEALIGLEEQSEVNFELVQLGMAIETIDHEFRSSVNGIRRSLRRLRRWGKANPQLDRLVVEIEGNFAHLDEYLKLFTPLQRRLYRRRIPIPGAEIRTYLVRLFKDRLKTNGITLKATKPFDSSVALAFPSMLYPVYINLIDNAIFWLADASQPREIILDVNKSDVLVSDTGPGVSERDMEAIFERGFTRKPGGRGLGLFIAREALRREGLDLTVDPPAKRRGARFRLVGILEAKDDSGE